MDNVYDIYSYLVFDEAKDLTDRRRDRECWQKKHTSLN